MKLRAATDNFQTELSLRMEGSRVIAELGGRTYELELLLAEGGQLLLSRDGRVFDCRINGDLRPGATSQVSVGTRRFEISLTDPKRLNSAGAAGAHAGGAARILAPMPGKVVRIMVAAGAQVEAGEGIVVVEAMKMQNEMKSPKAGVVSAISVEIGSTVNGGDVLAVID